MNKNQLNSLLCEINNTLFLNETPLVGRGNRGPGRADQSQVRGGRNSDKKRPRGDMRGPVEQPRTGGEFHPYYTPMPRPKPQDFNQPVASLTRESYNERVKLISELQYVVHGLIKSLHEHDLLAEY